MCGSFTEAYRYSSGARVEAAGEPRQQPNRHTDYSQIITALSYLLPDSTFYSTLLNLPPPDPTNPTSTTTFVAQTAIHNSLPVIEEIISLTEQNEEGFIKTEFDRRRTRLGASQPDQLKKEIGLEVWRTSKVGSTYHRCHLANTRVQLPLLYQEVLNHPNTSDELRRSTEANIIRYKQQFFYALPLPDPQKAVIGSELDELVNGIVAIGIPDELAWSIFLEGMDEDITCDYHFPSPATYLLILKSSFQMDMA